MRRFWRCVGCDIVGGFIRGVLGVIGGLLINAALCRRASGITACCSTVHVCVLVRDGRRTCALRIIGGPLHPVITTVIVGRRLVGLGLRDRRVLVQRIEIRRPDRWPFSRAGFGALTRVRLAVWVLTSVSETLDAADA